MNKLNATAEISTIDEVDLNSIEGGEPDVSVGQLLEYMLEGALACLFGSGRPH